MSSRFPTRIRYSGNSLVIVIPSNTVKLDGWKDGDEVDVTLDKRSEE